MRDLKSIACVIVVALSGCSGSESGAADSGVDTGTGDDGGGTDEPSSRIAVEVSCGSAVCALTEDGAVYCWGGDSAGQSGPDETLVEEIGKNRVFESGVVLVSSEGLNACAIREDASLWCWGDNWQHQLVAPVGDYSEDPVEIDLGGGVAEVVTGSSMCVLMLDGAVVCWGDNTLGAVGNGADLSECVEWNDCLESPTQVVGLEGMTVTNLEGGATRCVITDAGEAYCWGDGIPGPADGEDGLLHSSVPIHLDILPAPVLQKDGITALVNGNIVMRWGSNSSGQLGASPSQFDWSNVPVPAEGVEGVPARIGKGTSFTCAAMTDGRVQCWGENLRGELGRGFTSEYSSNPQDVTGLPGAATDVCAGSHSACALLDDGSIWCWGDNHSGQLGHDPDFDISQCDEWDECLFPTPVRVYGFGPE